MPLLVGGLTSFLTALFVTPAARAVAMRHGILDVPNARSAHREPRPRGGGVAIIVAVPIGLAAILVAGGEVDGRYWFIAAVATLLGIVGLIDDIRPIHFGPRLAAQVGAALLLVEGVGPITHFVLPGVTSYVRVGLPPPIAVSLTMVGVVAVINTFNFLDGIDGIAATQVACGALMLALLNASRFGYGEIVFGAAALGFLFHNWPPARIFLGDAGSQYIGCIVIALALIAERAAMIPATVSLLVFVPFGVDAAMTLTRRLRRGARWHEAHREHAYQVLVAAGWSHARTTLLYGSLASASGAALVLIQRNEQFAWVWWLVAALTMAMVGPRGRAWRHVMLPR